MAFGHRLACESLISFSWAICTARNILGSYPGEAAKNVAVTAIEINFDRPIGFFPFHLLSVHQN
jgi:hypothetical protein